MTCLARLRLRLRLWHVYVYGYMIVRLSLVDTDQGALHPPNISRWPLQRYVLGSSTMPAMTGYTLIFSAAWSRCRRLPTGFASYRLCHTGPWCPALQLKPRQYRC